jgi:hypothetical protein
MQYFSGSNADYRPFLKYLKPWFFPKDELVNQAFYEGSESERVPWGAWAVPLLLWTFFFVVLFLTMLCVLSMFRKQWVEKERLSFPLVQFALDMTEQGTAKGGVGTFFRNPLMWLGFGMATLFTVTNILAAFDPAVPHMGAFFTFAPSEPPWSALAGAVNFRPTVFGLGYLVPLDISLSVWASYFLMRFELMVAMMTGKTITGMPFDQQQGVGAYLGILFFLIWMARPHLRQVFRKAFRGDASVDDSNEAMPYRTAVFGGMVGFILLVGFAVAMGLGVLPAVLLFFIVLGFSLVYSKLRAEAGAPLVWTFPWEQQKEVLVYSVGSRVYSIRSLTILSVFRFLTRGFFISVPAYEADGMKMAPAGGIKQRQMARVIVVAILVGLATAYWIHLTSYYKWGANVLETQDPSKGGMRVTLATDEYTLLANTVKTPIPRDVNKTYATVGGMLTVATFTVLRKAFFRFPLHPMGFALAATFGGTIWGPFFFAWLIKFASLKLGGLRLYERLTPWALGIVFGEFFSAGVWSFMGLINPEWGPRWVIYFG